MYCLLRGSGRSRAPLAQFRMAAAWDRGLRRCGRLFVRDYHLCSAFWFVYFSPGGRRPLSSCGISFECGERIPPDGKGLPVSLLPFGRVSGRHDESMIRGTLRFL